MDAGRPRVNFAISKRGDDVGVRHLGIQVEDQAELREVYARLSRAERPVLEEGNTTCCYAKSEKSWIEDPQGVQWETFLTTGESTVYGNDAPAAAPARWSLELLHVTTYNVLFLCTGNSARSILAEQLLNHWGRGKFRAFSAGSYPKGQVHPIALALLQHMKLPTEGLRSKSWDEFAKPGAPHLDFISPFATTRRVKCVRYGRVTR